MDVMNEGIDLGGMSIAIAPSGMYIYIHVYNAYAVYSYCLTMFFSFLLYA